MPKAFGVSYDPSIPYRTSWDCPECGWSWSENQTDDTVAGFTPEQPFTRSASRGVTGILIIECPNDFSKFWFHTSFDDEAMEDIRARIQAEEKEKS
jgi:hypothetical protein